jgi:uncharacterized OB-fold protein
VTEPAAPDVHPVLFSDDGLLGGQCPACDRRHFPRSQWCPWCGAEGATEVVLSDEGRLWAWTTVHAPPPGYLGEVPFGFGVVDLPADGLQVVTRITETDIDALELGQPMRYVVEPVGEHHRTWAFAPAPGAAT